MKAEKKTLILLSPGFPSDEQDSTCLPAQQAFVRTLKNNFPSIDVQVIAFQYPFRKEPYSWNGISILPLNGRNRGGIFRLFVWMKAWRALYQLKKKNDGSGILSFWCTDCALVGKWFAKRYKLKHFCWILGQDAKKENRFVSFIRPAAGELIALSDFLMHEFNKNHHIKPFTVVSNAIDPSSFAPLASGRTIDVIGVGSLIPLKQYDLFVRVLKEIVPQFPGLKVLLCGKGPEEGALQSLIIEAGLNKNIQLLSERPHDQILLLLQQSKVLLHPSRYEGYSTVCLEALYAGCHVISFRSPGDIKKTDHWHVVKSEKEMKDKLVQLLSDPLLHHNRVLLHKVEDSARMIVKLFD